MPAGTVKKRPKPTKARKSDWKDRIEKFKRTYMTPNDGSGDEEDSYWEVSGKYALFYCPVNDEDYPSQMLVLGWGNGCLITLNTEFVWASDEVLLDHLKQWAKKNSTKGTPTFQEYWEATEDEPRIDDVVIFRMPLYEYYQKHKD